MSVFVKIKNSYCNVVVGPDVLTLTIGSDIARGPNTPRPACRGYLHKRTQSGLIKGWRKRWFVLTHDCCLYYYRHKRVSKEQTSSCDVASENTQKSERKCLLDMNVPVFTG